jgi:hypothetical protein
VRRALPRSEEKEKERPGHVHLHLTTHHIIALWAVGCGLQLELEQETRGKYLGAGSTSALGA